jgi:hypothetical protein
MFSLGQLDLQVLTEWRGAANRLPCAISRREQLQLAACTEAGRYLLAGDAGERGVVKRTRNRFILIVTAALMHFGRTD